MRVHSFFWTGGRRLSPFVLFLVIGVAGCGGTAPTPMHPVRGKVLFDGKPPAGALVVLHPLGPAGAAPRPRAKVEEDGSFTVGTFDARDGAPAGEYAVTVQWWRSSATGKGSWQDEAPPRNRLPVHYSLTSSSGLRARVAAGDNELPAFELKK
jgi:hypothetical protein